MRILNLVKEIPLGIKYNISSYPDGQQNIDIIDNDFISYSKSNPVTIKSRLNNWKDLELICAANACLKQLEVPEIHLYVPYFLGSRSDRRFTKGGNNYLKDIICPVINLQGFKSVTVLDPHSSSLECCIDCFKGIDNSKLVDWSIRQIYQTTSNIFEYGNNFENCILVSPDAGASKKIYKLAEQIGYKGDIITCSKDRDGNGKLTKCVVPKGDYGFNNSHNNKDIIIIDDLIDGGNTFINIAKEFKKGVFKGKIYLIITHGIFSKGLDELAKHFDGIYTTNSYTNCPQCFIPNKYYDLDTVKIIKQLDVF